MDFVKNKLGRMVPTVVNGVEKKPFSQAYDPGYSDPYAGRPGRAKIRSGKRR